MILCLRKTHNLTQYTEETPATGKDAMFVNKACYGANKNNCFPFAKHKRTTT